MATTSLSDEMIKNFVRLNKEEQKSVVQMIKTFLQGKEKEVKPQTLEDYNLELRTALKAAKKGAVTSVKLLEEEMKLW
jgi:hypothetical protein